MTRNTLKPNASSNILHKSASSANDLSSLYAEHHWNAEECKRRNPASNIDVTHPEKSSGLSTAKAKELFDRNGPNKLPSVKESSDLQLFFAQFNNQLWYILGAAATFSMIGFFYDPSDKPTLAVALILYVMIFVMCLISFHEERSARRVVRGFENLLPQQCSVVRDGGDTTVSAEELVVGDIIKIRAGTRVPADARILACRELRIESSSVTGESEPVEYQTDAVDASISIFESHNVAFNGSMCVDGEGVALVIKTGMDTIIGQVATMTTNQKNKKSRLEKQIKYYVKFLTLMSLLIGLICLLLGGYLQHWKGMILLLVTSFTVCALAVIPVGMPTTVTSIITIVARRLARRNVYLKRLDIAEALGSANIIASDKTGTLTKNQMTVTDVWYSNEYVSELPEHKIFGSRRTLTVKTISKVASPLKDLLVVMTVCSGASFDSSQNNQIADRTAAKKNGTAKNGSANGKIKSKPAATKIEMPNLTERGLSKKLSTAFSSRFTWNRVSDAQIGPQNTIQRRRQRIHEQIQGLNAIGAPSEVALIKYAEQLINVHEFRRKYHIVFEIPFNSKRKYHMVVARINEVDDTKSRYMLMMKGAPEIVIGNCDRILATTESYHDAEETKLTSEKMAEFQHAYDTFGAHGRRVIGFAHKTFIAEKDAKFSGNDSHLFEDLVFLGVCAIMDPPRDETTLAIKHCKAAGIKVFMVTGDHHITATAIAKQIGLIGDEKEGGERDWEIVKGEEIRTLSDADWDRLVQKRNLVFARTTPEQKFRIVEECQKRNQIISMTGDGVNDAPALKKSDIGVGMGSGSDVAKQASDIVLVDDNFSSMVGAVEEGRLMFDNIKKMLVYQMTHAPAEIWAFFIHYCFGMPIGLTALMVLSIDMGTELIPGIALCKEPPEGDIMQIPPREKNEVLVGPGLLFYSYGYTGNFQALGCFLAYCSIFWSYGINISDLWMTYDTWMKGPFTSNGHTFSVAEQEHIQRQVCSAWHTGIIFGQVFHIYSCRTLRQQLLSHGLFRNRQMTVAVPLVIFINLIYVYMPGVNWFLGGAPVPWFCWAVVGLMGLFIVAYNEIRKYILQRWTNNSTLQLLFKL